MTGMDPWQGVKALTKLGRKMWLSEDGLAYFNYPCLFFLI